MNASPPQKRKAAPAGDGLAFKKAPTAWQTHPHGANLCAEIKARVSLRDAAGMFGIELPRDGVKFCSPFRPDPKPSCSIKNEVMRDWSRDERFDSIAFYAAAQGITNTEAIRILAERLNIATSQRGASERRPSHESEKGSVIFDVREPSDTDHESIIETRKLSPEGISGLLLAHDVGVLHFADVAGFRCWLVADESKRCAEARRLDGKAFPALGNLAERKAHTLKGSTKSWPVGLALRVSESRAEHLRRIPLVLVEGGPDLLAAFALLGALPSSEGDVQPVAMLGAGASINAQALAQIAGRRVLVLAHGDRAGVDCAARWGKQLSEAACKVQLRHLPDGQDLNDLVSKHGLNAAREVLL
jgi:hypothetical protein